MKNLLVFFFIFFSVVSVYSQSDNTDELLAAQYFQNKEYDKAVELYEKLFQRENSIYFYQPYLTCLLELKDFISAEKLIRRQIKRYPQDLTFMTDLGYLFKITGDAKKAQKEFDGAIKKLEPSPEQVIALANSFMRRDEPDFAIKTFVQARKVFDGTLTFSMEMAEIYRKTNRPKEQIDIYMKALLDEPELTERIQGELQNYLDGDLLSQKVTNLKQVFLQQIQQHPDAAIFYDMMIWLAIQQNDFAQALVQSKALDKRNKEDGYRIFELSNLALSNQDYNTAIEALKYVISKGEDGSFYGKARIMLGDVMYRKIVDSFSYSDSELKELITVYDNILKDFGYNQNTALIIRDYAHLQAFYNHDVNKGLEIIEKAMLIQPVPAKTKAYCKLEYADILLLSGDVWESSLLYSQVEKEFKNEPIGHEAKYKNAKLSYYRGEFLWAQAQLDVLKAATSKLIANDAMQLSLLINDNIGEDTLMIALGIYSRADLLWFQNKYNEALLTLDSIKNISLSHPIFDEVLYKKAEIELKRGDYEKASVFLEQIVSAYSDDILGDDALYKLADLKENYFKDKDKALQMYQEFLEKYPGSVYVFDVRKRLRKLRGDKVVN